MCGRFYMGKTLMELIERYKLQDYLEAEILNQETYPTDNAVVVLGDEQRKLKSMKWGFVNPHNNKPLINARSETVNTKYLFKDAFKNNRCLIPVTAFYEWKKQGNTSTKYKIGLENEKIFSLAGIFSTSLIDAKPHVTFTILTTYPNEQIKEIHNRMPVIIKEEDEAIWLGTNTEMINLLGLLKPYHNIFDIQPDTNSNDLTLF
ncbi:SOS response-associated peptidase [Clostridiaceae bacterium M8S5]|nr:SOS response-associated peptidase [Clostridiaceae bacterium M8S5]